MRHYTHLSADERDRIAELHARDEDVPAIARDIGEESQRWAGARPQRQAQALRGDSHPAKRRPRRRLDYPALVERVHSSIVYDHWSPEQVEAGLGSSEVTAS